MKINLHSFYNHFGCHKPAEGEKFIECYNDFFVMDNKGGIALLIEPRSIMPWAYQHMESHWSDFDFVFTHDDELLKKPNARRILWGGVCNYGDYGAAYGDMPKTKNISFVSSDKEMCELHVARKNLARELNGKVDSMGTFNGGPKVNSEQIYGEYRFSIAFENWISDYWFTEKICNCFAFNTVPIYFGARKIGEFFDERGIIRAESIDDIRRIVDYLQENGEEEYEKRLPFIEENRKRVAEYENFERWFFKTYEKELEDFYGNEHH